MGTDNNDRFEEPFVCALAERLKIDVSRLSISPVVYDGRSMTFKRCLMLDGKVLEAHWEPDNSTFTGSGTSIDTTTFMLDSLADQIRPLI